MSGMDGVGWGQLFGLPVCAETGHVSGVSAAEEIPVEAPWVITGHTRVRSEQGRSLIAIHLVDRGHSRHNCFVSAANHSRSHIGLPDEIGYFVRFVDEVLLFRDRDMGYLRRKVVVPGAVAFANQFDETVE